MRLAAFLSFIFIGMTAAAPPPEAVVALQKHLHQVMDEAKPAIACILVSRSDRYANDFRQGPSAAGLGKLGDFRPPVGNRFWDAAQREQVKRLDLAHPETVPESYGSGVVIDDTGLILTNFRVIENATKIYVRLPGVARGSYADIQAADPRSDLAVLKLIHPPTDLKSIAFGDGGKVRQGDWVVALANPFAAGFRDGNPSASLGIVSNVRRQGPGPPDETKRAKPLSQYGTLIQTDVRLNVGCSGGALLNMDGQLIGLTTAMAAIVGSETPGGYAIPMDTNTKNMIEVLKSGKEIEYGFLGVTVNPEERTDGKGVMIQDAFPGMPAARAKLMSRDVVIAINGTPVREQDDLFLNISAALAGTEVKIQVLRNGEPMTVKPRLAKSPNSEWENSIIASARPKAFHGLRVDYASTVSMGSDPPEGVLVKELEPGSPAEKKLKPSNAGAWQIITHVDDQPVPTPAEFYRLTDGKKSVTLVVVEAGSKPKTVILP